MAEAAKVSLVTVIAAFELNSEQGLEKELRALGMKGYSLGKVNGWGIHGETHAGLVDSANVRIEAVVPTSVADKVLDLVAKKGEESPIVAFAHDVKAVPRDRFR